MSTPVFNVEGVINFTRYAGGAKAKENSKSKFNERLSVRIDDRDVSLTCEQAMELGKQLTKMFPVKTPEVKTPEIPEVEIDCIDGRAKLRIKGRLQILCNNRRKWDCFHWSFSGDGSRIALQGLWRGKYADAMASTEAVVKALKEVGAEKRAEYIQKLAKK